MKVVPLLTLASTLFGNTTRISQYNNSLDKYFIILCDLYQGKNAKNIGIPPKTTNLMTTQNAVINAVIPSKVGKDLIGMHLLFLDNCHACANLFILSKEKSISSMWGPQDLTNCVGPKTS